MWFAFVQCKMFWCIAAVLHLWALLALMGEVLEMYECLNCKVLNRVSLWFPPNFYLNWELLSLMYVFNPYILLVPVKSYSHWSNQQEFPHQLTSPLNCDESLPLKIVISCSSMCANEVCFCAVQKVLVYCCSTSSMGSVGADGQSPRDNLWSSHSIWFMASVGWPSVASTLCHRWSNSLVRSLSQVWFSFSQIFKIIHFFMLIIFGDVSVSFLRVRVLLQGLSFTSVVGSHCMSFVCVNVGLVRVSYLIEHFLKRWTWPKTTESWH